MAKSPETPLEILDRKVVRQNGPLVTTRTWVKGKHPGGVVINNGWSGDGGETYFDKEGIKPFETFWVETKPEEKSSNFK